ncbi:MAG: hypothetical protein ACK5XN_18725 [Bacteroidota bacterium]|jgi:hypothetical protein
MTTKQFNELSKDKKAVLVTQDVLAQIEANKYVPNTGAYVRFEEKISFEGDIKSNFDKLPQCRVCALGSMLLSCTNLGNVLTTDIISNDRIGHYELQDDGVKELFNSIFSDKQLLMIETSFEGYSEWECWTVSEIKKHSKPFFNYCEDADRYADDETLSFEETLACQKVFLKYEDHQERLEAICNNIIKNSGVFIP